MAIGFDLCISVPGWPKNTQEVLPFAYTCQAIWFEITDRWLAYRSEALKTDNNTPKQRRRTVTRPKGEQVWWSYILLDIGPSIAHRRTRIDGPIKTCGSVD